MIKSLTINNFQSHNHSELEFSEGLNIISGSSDHGKSSIIRACDWVINNRPSGDSFRSDFAKPKELTSVQIVTEKGSVTREKNKTTNHYVFKEENFKALRTNVPEEVADFIQMKPVNIQKQHEQFFLLDKTPGQVAKSFNEVAGLQVMDKAILLASQLVKKSTNSLLVTKDSLKKNETSQEELSWVKDADQSLIEIENLEKEINEFEFSFTEINQTLNKIKEVDLALNDLPPNRLEEIISLISQIKENEKRKEKYQVIEKTINTYSETESLLKKYENLDKIDSVFKQLKQIFLLKKQATTNFQNINLRAEKLDLIDVQLKQYQSIDKAETFIKQAENSFEQYQLKSSQYEAIKKNIVSFSAVKRKGLIAKKEYQKIEKEFQVFKQEIKICPLCEGKL